MIQCQGQRQVLVDGVCIKCPNFKKPNKDKNICEDVKCLEREYVDLKGDCQACPDYYI